MGHNGISLLQETHFTIIRGNKWLNNFNEHVYYYYMYFNLFR